MKRHGKRILGNEQTNVAKAKIFFQWSALFCLTLVALFFAAHIVRAAIFEQRTWEIFSCHPLATFGIPFSALFAFGLVLVFERFSGTFKFKVLGMEFSGAAGPAAFWVLLFLVQVLALKLLW